MPNDRLKTGGHTASLDGRRCRVLLLPSESRNTHKVTVHQWQRLPQQIQNGEYVSARFMAELELLAEIALIATCNRFGKCWLFFRLPVIVSVLPLPNGVTIVISYMHFILRHCKAPSLVPCS